MPAKGDIYIRYNNTDFEKQPISNVQQYTSMAFPGGTVVKNLPANVGDAKDVGSIPESGRYPGVGNGIHSRFLPGKFH